MTKKSTKKEITYTDTRNKKKRGEKEKPRKENNKKNWRKKNESNLPRSSRLRLYSIVRAFSLVLFCPFVSPPLSLSRHHHSPDTSPYHPLPTLNQLLEEATERSRSRTAMLAFGRPHVFAALARGRARVKEEPMLLFPLAQWTIFFSFFIFVFVFVFVSLAAVRS